MEAPVVLGGSGPLFLSFFVVLSLSLSHKCGPRVGTVLVALKVIFSQGGRATSLARAYVRDNGERFPG